MHYCKSIPPHGRACCFCHQKFGGEITWARDEEYRLFHLPCLRKFLKGEQPPLPPMRSEWTPDDTDDGGHMEQVVGWLEWLPSNILGPQCWIHAEVITTPEYTYGPSRQLRAVWRSTKYWSGRPEHAYDAAHHLTLMAGQPFFVGRDADSKWIVWTEQRPYEEVAG